jgi:pimeloyl-ACP methyl ester carboxylesterase
MPARSLRFLLVLSLLSLPAMAAAQDSPDATVPPTPGTLLATETIPATALPDGVQGWRLTYATSIDDQTPATATATVFAPDPLPDGPLPVIAWAHGTTGLVERCMPSRFPDPTAGIPALPGAIARGWAIVATDYGFATPDGPHPFLIGEGQARGTLDGLRAARTLPGATLGPQTVVWGHAQGGHAALWTGITAPAYAPDVTLAGIAAIAPLADPAAIFAAAPAVDLLLGPYVATAYAAFFDDLALPDIVTPGARVATADIAALCTVLPPEDTARIFARAATIPAGVLRLDNPAFAARLADNAVTAPIAPPLLVVQGADDIVVPPALTAAWADARCAAGQQMDRFIFTAQDHAGIVRPGSPLEEPLLTWTAARLASAPPPPPGPTTGF